MLTHDSRNSEVTYLVKRFFLTSVSFLINKQFFYLDFRFYFLFILFSIKLSVDRKKDIISNEKQDERTACIIAKS